MKKGVLGCQTAGCICCSAGVWAGLLYCRVGWVSCCTAGWGGVLYCRVGRDPALQAAGWSWLDFNCYHSGSMYMPAICVDRTCSGGVAKGVPVAMRLVESHKARIYGPAYTARLSRLVLYTQILRKVRIYGHITLTAPYPVRSAKLSRVKFG